MSEREPEDLQVDASDQSEPSPAKTSFTCPHCGILATQGNRTVGGPLHLPGMPLTASAAPWPGSWRARQCFACSDITLWRDSEMVWPRVRRGPKPSSDIPVRVRAVYEEAREVSGISGKSAAALLRLALQILVDDLEPGTKSLDSKIGALVDRGLEPGIQQAMDALRVIGNSAVHPGQIDLDDNQDLIPALFDLFNLIIEQIITRPKKVADLYKDLPAGALDAVKRRDGRSG